MTVSFSGDLGVDANHAKWHNRRSLMRPFCLALRLLLTCWSGWFVISGVLAQQPAHVVDLLVLRDQDVVNRAGGVEAFEQLSAAATARANLVFQNSGANVRLRLAGVDRFTWSSWPDDGHRRLLAQAADLPELNRLRDAHAADLVCWVSEWNNGGQINGLRGPSAEHAFSAITLGALQAGLLPAALAPNFGCQASRGNTTNLAALPYGYGFTFPLDASTYGTIESGAPFRVPLFSSPALRYRGLALGIPEGQPNAADNVRVLNLTAPVVARFRGAAPKGIPPDVAVNAPAAGSVLNAGAAVPVAVTVGAADPPNRIERVDLFDGNRRLESRVIGKINDSVRFDWVPGPAHEAELYFVVTDTGGVSTVSTPLNYPVKAVNDSFAYRTRLTGSNVTLQTDLRDTTIEVDEPPFLGGVPADAGSLWWSWEAPARGQVTISLAPKGFPSEIDRLTAYVGDSLQSLLPFATAYVDFLNFGLALSFDVAAGEVVQLQAIAPGHSWFNPGDQRGLVELKLNFSAAPPNDHYRHREWLTGSEVDVPINLAGATAEPGEAPGRSAWWTWKAPFPGYAIWSAGEYESLFNPVVTEAYGDNRLPVSRPPGQQWGPLRFRVYEGSTVDLAARWPWGGSFNGSTGQSTLHLRLVPFATNDFSSQATLVEGLSSDFSGNLAQATAELDNSLYAPATLWWKWTAPETGIFLLHKLSGHDLRAYLDDLVRPVPLAPMESPYTNTVAYRAEAGQTYVIRAEGSPVAANSVVEGRLRLSTVSLGSSAPDGQLTTGAPADFIVYAEDGDGPLQVAKLFLDGHPFATLTGLPWRVAWTNPVAGEHRLTAQVSNTAGEPLAVAPLTLAVRPPNDRFTNATLVQGNYWEADTGAAAASPEPGEPGADLWPNSLWWRWTAPVTGPVRLKLRLGSYFGQSLQRVAVFAGTELASLSEVPLTGTSDAERDFAAVAGQEYRIRVASAPAVWEAPYRSHARLEVFGVPLNDAYANATLVEGSVADLIGNLTFATRELNDRDAAGNNVAATIWWKWVAPESRSVVLTISGESDTPRVVVFAHPRTVIASDRDQFGGPEPQLTFVAVAGRTNYIMVAQRSTRGRVQLKLDQRQAYTNDDPGQAIELSGPVLRVEGNNLGATRVADEPSHLQQTVWYRFVPTQTGQVQFTISSPDQYARVAAYVGGPGAWIRRGQTREEDVYRAVTILAQAGEPVFFAVGTRTAQERGGPFTLEVTYQPRPANDNFEDRIALTGTSVEFGASPFGSTYQGTGVGGPVVEDRRPDIWFEWTAPLSGLARLSRSSEVFWNRFTVFAGNDPAQLRPVPLEYVNGFAWPVRERQVYQLRFLGDYPYSFEERLELLPAPANDAFAGRQLLAGEDVTFVSTPLLGTLEPGEPRHGPTNYPAFFGYGHTLWYSWVAPSNGVAALEVLLAHHGVRAAVYVGESLASLQPAVFTGTQANVSFNAEAGRTYHLALDAKSPDSGPIPTSFDAQFRLRLVPPPANDSFADRQPVTLEKIAAIELVGYETLMLTADWTGATAEEGEPGHISTNRPALRSLWYQWTSPESGFAWISAEHASVALYRGERLDQLVRVERDPALRWLVEGGETLALAVDSDAAGPGRMFITFERRVGIAIRLPLTGSRRPPGPLVLPFGFRSYGGFLPSVELFADGESFYLNNSPSTDELEIQVPNLSLGTHEFFAIARINDNYSATSAPVRIEITTQPPPNDDFANRPRLTGTQLLLTGYDFMAATREPDEPLALPFGRGETVWWEWTAPTNGWVYADVYGDPLPAVAGIYRGGSLTNLTQVSASWSTGISDQAVQAHWFPVHAGEVFQIQADRPQPLADRFTSPDLRLSIQVNAAPPNDDFENRIPIPGLKSTNAVAANWGTTEAGEPQPAGTRWHRSLWWSWTAPADGQLILKAIREIRDDPFWPWQRDIGSPTPALAVYVGENLPALHALAHDGTGRRLTVPVTRGTQYQIEVAEIAESVGTLPAGVALDFSTLRLAVQGQTELMFGDPVELQVDTHLPDLEPAILSVLYSLNGRFLVQQDGGPFRLHLTDLPAGTNVIGVQVTTADGLGWLRAIPEVVLRVRLPNDDFTNATALDGPSAALIGNNLAATTEPGEPELPPAGHRSLWWRWRPPSDGVLYLDDVGSEFSPFPGPAGPLITVWQGPSISNLTLVASNLVVGPSPGTSQVKPGLVLPVLAANDYFIAVDGVNGGGGDVRLQLQFHAAPANDDFSHATIWTGTTNHASGSWLQATAEPGEPAHTTIAPKKSLWWRWTAPSSGRVLMRAEVTHFPTALAPYIGDRLDTLTPVSGAFPGPYVFVATGETLSLALEGGEGEDGRFELAFSFEPMTDNDAFADRVQINASNATLVGIATGAGREDGEPEHALPVFGPVSGGSLWWTWTAPGSGDTKVQVEDGVPGTVLVYSGETLTTLLPVAAGPSGTTFYARSGETYQIAVVSRERSFVLHVNGPPPEPVGHVTDGRIRDDGSYQLTVEGLPGQSFAVLVSRDLLSWEVAAVETLQAPRLELAEEDSSTEAARFYRILPLDEASFRGLLPTAIPQQPMRRISPDN